MLLSIFFFILAGLAEIGGGYLVWLYMRDDKSPVYLLAGAIILFFISRYRRNWRWISRLALHAR